MLALITSPFIILLFMLIYGSIAVTAYLERKRDKE